MDERTTEPDVIHPEPYFAPGMLEGILEACRGMARWEWAPRVPFYGACVDYPTGWTYEGGEPR